MNYVSVCSGIESATVAWHPLGWRPLLFAEIAPFPSRVLAHHYPRVVNVGDFTAITQGVLPAGTSTDLLVGGTPCQAFSIAGLRGGLSDARGNLALEFMRLADRLRPRWIVWENVPGVLSSNGGRDFGSILGALGELGYGFAYRVLDAQFIGVPQRRRRVFVVGHLGDWRRAAAVLFERTSLRRDTPSRRAARADAARGAESGARVSVTGSITHALTSEGYDASEDGSGRGTPIIPFDETQITSRENRSNPSPGDPSPTLARGARPPTIAFGSKSYGQDAGDISPTLTGCFRPGRENGGTPPAIAFHHKQDPISGPVSPALGAETSGMGVAIPLSADCITGRSGVATTASEDASGVVRLRNPSLGVGAPDDPSFTLKASQVPGVAVYGGGSERVVRERERERAACLTARTGGRFDLDTESFALHGYRVRKLTPRECERLQGFPDDYTALPGAKDGPRYHALGNSMATVVMRWLAKRIEIVDRCA